MGTHIEINGKRYDARTGKLLTSDIPAPVIEPKRTAHTSRTAIQVVAPVVSKQVHAQAQRSQTLMRHAVKKPTATKAPLPHTVKSPATLQATPIQSTRHMPLYKNTDPERAKRADQIKRSQLVTKFSDISSHAASQTVPTRIEQLPVVQAPQQHRNTKPLSPASSAIEDGLRRAQSHKESLHHAVKTKKSRKKTRLISLATSGLTLLLLTGFIAYQNVPNISMRYASTRAGIEAKAPTYQPSGFSLNNKIIYTPGQITMSFSSNSDDRTFTITQRESGWNSETLRTNYVSSTGSTVQTFEDKGRTIYLYGDSSATWVNGGVWYDIKGDSRLNSDQLIRIATSM